MPDEEELTTDGEEQRPRRRRRASPSPAEAGAVATSDGPTSELWTPESARRAVPDGLRVAPAGPTKSQAKAAEAPAVTASPTTVAPDANGAPPAVASPPDIDGVPGVYDDGAQWLRSGVKRQPRAILVALIFGWTGVWLALWGAAIGAAIGVLVALGTVDTTALGREVSNLGGGQGVTIVSILGGLFFGAIGGFLEVLRYVLAATPWEAIVALATGLVLSTLITIAMATFERAGLRIRGYRRLSRDEVRRVAPLIREIAEAMDLDGLPRFAMSDTVIPNAWTHMRTIVITSGLLQTLDDAELRAVLAHELQHWRSGDAVGLHVVWAAAWPIAITYNVGMLIAGNRQGMGVGPPSKFRGLLVLIGWVIAWPAWVILTIVIAPTVAVSQRRYEYAADAAAAKLGYAAAMISALRKMGAFEGGRTGWEEAMTATHPPTELRIEALQPPKPDDAQYQEGELRGPGWQEITRMLRSIIRPRSARS
jgi:Zn-dependent protease with chaperone function